LLSVPGARDLPGRIFVMDVSELTQNAIREKPNTGL